MDEANRLSGRRRGLFPFLRSRPCLRGKLFARLGNQRGQAIVEYILVLIVALGFTRFIFFNKDIGFKAMVDKTMLRLGSFVEQNLKTGTKVGGDGLKSLEAYGGTSRWTN